MAAKKKKDVPTFSSVVRVQVTFLLDYEKNAELPMRICNDSSKFILNGMKALYTVEEVTEKYGEVYVLPGSNYKLSRLTPVELERWRKQRLTAMKDWDLPAAVKEVVVAEVLGAGTHPRPAPPTKKTSITKRPTKR